MIAPKIYAEALHAAISETDPKDHDRVLDNFVSVLAQNGELNLFERIEQEYLRIANKSKGITEVEVTTASNTDQKELLELLNKAVGGNIEIKHKINTDLLGGIVVRAGDMLIDASLKTSLEKLRKSIAK